MLGYTYPRIDAAVSKHVNHLLKSPFCIHPSTGRVCVPLASADIDSFEPTEVPTVGQLLRELEKARSANKDSFKSEEGGWEHTSLRPYVEHFERHCQGIIKDARDAKKCPSALWVRTDEHSCLGQVDDVLIFHVTVACTTACSYR